MGMNEPGELRRLVKMGSPSVGLITNVAPAHLEGLKSVEGVAKAKGELFDGLPLNAIGVINTDDDLIKEYCVPFLARRPRILFGRSMSNDVYLSKSVVRENGLEVLLMVENTSLEVTVPVLGEHQALNVAGAIAASIGVGATLAEIEEGLARVELPGGRMKLIKVRDDFRVIDDTYNANPASMLAAGKALVELSKFGPTAAILGDMGELGEKSERLHFEVGTKFTEMGVEHIVAVGPLGQALIEGARLAGAKSAHHVGMEEDIAGLVKGFLDDRGWVLVKGSRSMRMERVVEALSEAD